MYALLNRLSVRQRIRAIVAIFIGSIVIATAFDLVRLRDVLWHEKEQQTRQLVQSGLSVLRHFHGLQLSGELSEAAARQAALRTVRSMRFDSTEGAYFWINDLDAIAPRILMHPLRPELEGRPLDEAALGHAKSRRLGTEGPFVAAAEKHTVVQEIILIAREGGHGYVTYDWPKGGAADAGAEKRYPKLSYVAKFEPWGWVIGSGVHIDDVDRTVFVEMRRNLLAVAGGSALMLLLASLIAGSITGPLLRTIATMRRLGDGEPTARLPVQGRSEIAELARGFNEMLDHLQARDAELARHREELESEVARRTAELRDANVQLEKELAERRRTEHAMRESRARSRALLDATSESVLLLAPDGEILEINAWAAGRFGDVPARLVGRNFYDLMPPALVKSRRALVEEVTSLGVPIHAQDRRGGIYFDNHLYPVCDEHGAVESIAVYAKDATEQQRTQKVEDIFRQLDTVLLKWRMNVEGIAHIFCDGLLPVFDLVAAWVGRTERDGRLTVLAEAASTVPALLEPWNAPGLRWDDGSCALPIGEVVRSGYSWRETVEVPPPGPDAAAAGARHAVLLLPLKVRDETWGVVALYGSDANAFDAADPAVRLGTIAVRFAATLEAALQQEWLGLLDSALAGVSNAVLITDASGRILWANRAVATLTGYSGEALIGKTPAVFRSGRQDAEFYRRFWATISGGGTWRGEIVNARRDGSHYTASQTVSPLTDASGKITHFVSIIEDVTDRNALEERIRHAASYDLLTDLPNRGLFLDRLGQALALARREGRSGALLFLDLDGFKGVNDRLGHAAGDELLVQVAHDLRGQLRECDTVARLGGDEFTVILSQPASADDAVRVAEKLRAAISRPRRIAGTEIAVGVSVGIALFPEHGDSVEPVLKAADGAMYAAKRAGRNRHAFAGEQAARDAAEALQRVFSREAG